MGNYARERKYAKATEVLIQLAAAGTVGYYSPKWAKSFIAGQNSGYVTRAQTKIAELNTNQAKTKSETTLTVSGTTFEVAGSSNQINTITPVPYKELRAEQQQIIEKYNVAPTLGAWSYGWCGVLPLVAWGLSRLLNSGLKEDTTFFENAGEIINKILHPEKKNNGPKPQPGSGGGH